MGTERTVETLDEIAEDIRQAGRRAHKGERVLLAVIDFTMASEQRMPRREPITDDAWRGHEIALGQIQDVIEKTWRQR